jgi:glycosyltransferase involved in cell wall biosynthesis
VRVGFFKPEGAFVSRQVVEGNFLKFLAEYVETVPVPVPRVLASPPSHFTEQDRLAGRLAVLSDLEELGLDYVYSGLGSLTPFLLIARELNKSSLSFVIPALAVSPDGWLVHWMLVAPLLRPGDIVMIPNETTWRALERVSPVFGEHGALIPWPIDLQRVVRMLEEPGQPVAGERTVVYVGRMVHEKNVHLLIESMPAILREVPGAQLQLFVPTLAGGELNVSPQYYQQLRRCCKKLSVARNVDFIGPVGEKAKYRHIANSAALVSASLFSGETFGYAILEALACGTPVVCTAWNGHRDLVIDGYNGFLISTFWRGNVACLDEQGLRQGLINVLTVGAEERARLRRDAQTSATKYDYRRVIPNLVSVLGEQSSVKATAPRERGFQSFGSFLEAPMRATEGIWADTLLQQFGELTSLSYGALAGMRYGDSEAEKKVAFLRAVGELGAYLTAEYVSNDGQVGISCNCTEREPPRALEREGFPAA